MSSPRRSTAFTLPRRAARPRVHPWLRAVLAAASAIGLAAAAPAQPENPVYVDDAPRAADRILQARDLAEDNAGEAIRIYQELLDRDALRLVPLDEGVRDRFVSVRARVLRDLRSDPALLERYRGVERAAARRRLDAGEIEHVAIARPLTEAGLDAMLALAQRALESARFVAAIRWLDEAQSHPDLRGERAAACWSMLALAATYADAREGAHEGASWIARRDRALEALAALGDGADDVRPLVVRAVEAQDRPRIERGRGATDRTDARELVDLVPQTIWTLPLGAPTRRSDPFRDLAPAGSRSRPAIAPRTRVAPTVTGGLVVLNDDDEIRAIDRYTGRELWRTAARRSRRGLGSLNPASDLRACAIEGDRLVTITGAADTDRATSGNTAAVVCLDVRDGSELWATMLNAARRPGGAPEHEGLFPHGTPVVSEGRVHLLARKISGERLVSCYAVSLDLRTGAPVWIRHLASSGSALPVERPLSSIVLDEGELFVSDPAGVIACLDAETGMVRWLRRASVPIEWTRTPGRPWEVAGPLVGAGQVAALSPDRTRILLLDRARGAEIWSGDATDEQGWGTPAYLVGDDEWIYAVGDDVRAFVWDRPELALWRIPEAPLVATDLADMDDVEQRLRLTGRVQIAGELLVVPVDDEIMIHDRETGESMHRLRVSRTGNVVADGPQLVVTTHEAVDAYMSLARAEEMIRGRIAERPDDPSAALSLLQLAVRADDLDLALEAASLVDEAVALASPEDAERGAAELFDGLLRMHLELDLLGRPQASEVYERLARAARTPEERVRERLARGDWHARRAGEGALAAAAWRDILDDRALARRLVAFAPLDERPLRLAEDVALSRLSRLVRERGATVIADAAAEARRAYEALDPAAVTADALLDVVRLAPTTEVAGAAALEAAALLADPERDGAGPRAALGAIAEAWALAGDGAAGPVLLGAMLERLDRLGDEDAVDRLLADRRARAPGSVVVLGGERLTLDQARRRLAPTPRARPRIATAPTDVARVIEGAVVDPADGAPSVRVTSRALLRDDAVLVGLDARDLARRWTVPIDGVHVETIVHDEDEVIVWSSDEPATRGLVGEPRIVAVDPDTGSVRWRSPELAAFLEPGVGRPGRMRSAMPSGFVFNPAEVVVRAGPDHVYLLQRSGGAAAFARRGDGRPAWARPRALEQIHEAAWSPFGLVVAGLDAPERDPDELVPRVLLLDPDDGSVVHAFTPAAPEGVAWLDVDAEGHLLVGHERGIERYDLARGIVRWRNLAYAARQTSRARVGPGIVGIEDGAGQIRLLDVERGEVGAPLPIDGATGEWQPDPFLLVADATGLVAAYDKRLVRWSAEGRMTGADAVTDERDYRASVPVAGGSLVVSLHRHEPADERVVGVRGVRQRVYRLYRFAPDLRLLDEPIEVAPILTRLDLVQVLDGVVLLSTERETIAIPLDPDAPPRPDDRDDRDDRDGA